jgi:DNA polymerase I-like protein with 3'-5' exonuclease and polymerase domains
MQITVGEYVYQIRIYTQADCAMRGPSAPAMFAMDTETEIIKHGQPLVPALLQVCCHALRQVDVVPAHLMTQYMQQFYEINPDFHVAFHNAPFDLEVLGIREPVHAPLLAAIQANRVIDTGIRYMLRQLSIGRVANKWALDFVAKQLLRIEVEKDDEIRLSFRPGMPLTERHVKYAAGDAAVTALLVEAMPQGYPTEWHQFVGFLALSDIGRRGLCVDRAYMRKLNEDFRSKKVVSDEVLGIFGYYSGEPGNQKVLQRILQHVEKDVQFLENNDKLEFQRTEKKGAIQTTDASLSILGNRTHPFIDAYKGSDHQQKILSTYLNENLVRQDDRVHPRFTPLVRTGRTSCRGPNLQNLPRKENIRGIYIPTPGWVLYAADYSQLELCALAESCLKRFGFSEMANVINSGVDLHRWFAAEVQGGKPIEEVTDEERQMAKACNFGFPGGLGIKTFQYLAKTSYGVSLTSDECKDLKKVWLDAFPEMEGHFKPSVDRAFSTKEEDKYMATTITGRLRRNAGFCSACNYQFQGLAADGARIALWYMWLNRYRMVNFVHDEIITELKADEMLQYHIGRINDLMITGMEAAIPNVKIKVEGALMRRWYKGAKPVYDDSGRLVVWEPKVA